MYAEAERYDDSVGQYLSWRRAPPTLRHSECACVNVTLAHQTVARAGWWDSDLGWNVGLAQLARRLRHRAAIHGR